MTEAVLELWFDACLHDKAEVSLMIRVGVMDARTWLPY
jgi:hypothetical protein